MFCLCKVGGRSSSVVFFFPRNTLHYEGMQRRAAAVVESQEGAHMKTCTVSTENVFFFSHWGHRELLTFTDVLIDRMLTVTHT